MLLNSVILLSMILFQVSTIVHSLIVTGYRGFTQGVATSPSYDGNDTIYLLGGVIPNGFVFHQVWAYSLTSAKFSVVKEIEAGDVLTTAVDSQGNIYYFTYSLNSTSSLFKFTAKTRSVTMVTRFRRFNISLAYCSAVVDSRIYFIGSVTSNGVPTCRLYEYNLTSKEIRRTPQFSQLLINSTTVWDGSDIYVFGGKDIKNVDNKDIIKINLTNLHFEVLNVKMFAGISSNAFVVENTAIFFNEEYDLVFGDLRHMKMTIENLEYQFIDKKFQYFSDVYVKKRNTIYIFTCQGRIRGCAVLIINMNLMVNEEKEEIALTNTNILLPCGISGTPKYTVTWRKDEKLINNARLRLSESGVLNISSVDVDDAGTYACSITNAFGNATSNIQLSVKYRTEIRVWGGPNKPILPGENAEFVCTAVADETLLPVAIMWYKELVPIDTSFKSRYLRRSADVLMLLNATESDSGNYTCVAKTKLDTTNVTVLLVVQNSSVVEKVDEVDLESSIFLLLPLTLIIFAILLIVGLILTYCLCKYSKKSRLTQEELRQFKYGSSLKENESMEVYTNAQPYCPSYELPLNTFQIQREMILGEGEFGIVYKGVVNLENGKQDVAFKTTKPSTTDYQLGTKQLKSLLSELKVMIYIGDHPNIVKLIGAYTRQLKSGVVFVAAELCVHGSLERLLRSSDFVEDIKVADTNNRGEYIRRQVTLSMLRNWSLQIAKGMEYLTSKKIIHSDLASRNVLVDADMSIRITDFGLSRRIENYTNYVKMGTEPLPWRWMAVESLDVMNFSSQSDVWSFGVTLWEIWSMGSIPYPGISWTSDFVQKLKHGNRLPQPPYASFIMYQKMEECWKLEPSKRPTFSQLVIFLQQILYKEEKIFYVDTSNLTSY